MTMLSQPGLLNSALSPTPAFQCRPMINKPPSFEGLYIRIRIKYLIIFYSVSIFFSITPIFPTRIPMKGKGFINQGPTLGTAPTQ